MSARCRLQVRPKPQSGLFAWVALVAALMLVVGPSTVDAGERSSRVEFVLTVAGPDDVDDAELRARTHREVADEVVDRLESRLEAIGAKHHEVATTDDNDVRVAVFGDYSPAAIKGALIPSGHLELRPVLVDETPWMDVAPRLPAEVDIYNEPGSSQLDGFFLFASSSRPLHRAIGLLNSDEYDVYVFPHEEGWRTLNVGSVLATGSDVADVELQRGPVGTPYVSATLTSSGAQNVGADAGTRQSRRLAVVLDGEVVALQSVRRDGFGETVELQPPDHLRSMSAREDWAIQVAGRMAATIPVQLAEYEEE